VTGGAARTFAIAMQLAFASSGADAWKRAEVGGVRGVTIGPIENAYHPGVGYGSPAYDRALVEARAMGATWIAVTPFGRVADGSGTGVDLTFESPFERNRWDVARAVNMAHARGLRVMLVPHLWVESGEWRGDIDPKSDEGWARWAASYERFVLTWAGVAEETQAEMFSVGVELRTWVTTARAPSFVRVIHEVRGVYHGLLTYSANWDDVEETVVLGDIDVVGVNAFYPLAEVRGAPEATLRDGGRKVREKVHALAESWGKPVLFTETGYTTRADPAVRPWVWPDAMSGVPVDEAAQAVAYRALTAPLLDEPDFAGFFVWRVYANPDDVSQEAPWGFSPRGKLAELVVRDAFAAGWACDPWWRPRWGERAQTPGVY
jgi:glycosyl hydrolase family 113